jgi:hypothetical protein
MQAMASCQLNGDMTWIPASAGITTKLANGSFCKRLVGYIIGRNVKGGRRLVIPATTPLSLRTHARNLVVRECSLCVMEVRRLVIPATTPMSFRTYVRNLVVP